MSHCKAQNSNSVFKQNRKRYFCFTADRKPSNNTFCSLQVEYEVKWVHVTTLHSMADPFILTKDIAPKIIISSGLSLTMLWFVVFLLHILQPVIPPSFLLSFHLSLLLSSLPSRTFWVRCSVLLGKLLDHQPVDWRNRWGEFQLFSHFSHCLTAPVSKCD